MKTKMVRSSQLIGRYLEEINAYAAIWREQEAEPARRIREGDKSALNTLVKANLKFDARARAPNQGKGLAEVAPGIEKPGVERIFMKPTSRGWIALAIFIAL